MQNLAWEMTCTAETKSSVASAWAYWTNIANWYDPPAQFELDGPFASGTRGTTRMTGQDPMHWIIAEVTPPFSATIVLELRAATLSFDWRFQELSAGRTRITQRVSLRGENANEYLSQVRTSFTSNLQAGLNKMAAAIAIHKIQL